MYSTFTLLGDCHNSLHCHYRSWLCKLLTWEPSGLHFVGACVNAPHCHNRSRLCTLLTWSLPCAHFFGSCPMPRIVEQLVAVVHIVHLEPRAPLCWRLRQCPALSQSVSVVHIAYSRALYAHFVLALAPCPALSQSVAVVHIAHLEPSGPHFVDACANAPHCYNRPRLCTLCTWSLRVSTLLALAPMPRHCHNRSGCAPLLLGAFGSHFVGACTMPRIVTIGHGCAHCVLGAFGTPTSGACVNAPHCHNRSRLCTLCTWEPLGPHFVGACVNAPHCHNRSRLCTCLLGAFGSPLCWRLRQRPALSQSVAVVYVAYATVMCMCTTCACWQLLRSPRVS